MSLVVTIIALFLGNGSRQRAESPARHVIICPVQTRRAEADAAEVCFWSLLGSSKL
jgi:hypothetical protein